MNCPFCGADARTQRRFQCWTLSDLTERSGTCMERENESLKARIARLEEAVESLLPYAEATDDESSEWGPGRWKSQKLKRIIDEARKAKEAKP